jgi:hypothetical protein
MIRLFPSMLLLFLMACDAQVADKTLVLQYDDFGSPSAVHELLGMDWWQWQEHGDSRPRRYDIKVVVYRDLDLQQVRQAFPTNPSGELDYRYVDFVDAVHYLERMIAQNTIEPLTQRLTKTRLRIIDALGEP